MPLYIPDYSAVHSASRVRIGTAYPDPYSRGVACDELFLAFVRKTFIMSLLCASA